jgi:putative addiction module component (TIGR02574 family)
MSTTYSEVERQACLLSAEERAHLVETLLESLHDSSMAEVKDAWAAEIERRVAAYERGEATLVVAEEVFAKARRIIGQ